MAKRMVQGEEWLGNMLFHKKIQSEAFEHVLFKETIFRLIDFDRCEFRNCEFKDFNLGIDATFSNCKWIKCKFGGRNSNFGVSTFRNCIFVDVSVRSSLFSNTAFFNCTFSGRFHSIIFAALGKRSVSPFSKCDLREVRFTNVEFQRGVDLSTVILPQEGIRVFHNPDGKFTKLVRHKSLELPRGQQIALVALCPEFQDAQDPLVFDKDSLANLFRDDATRQVFESLANGFERTSP